MKQELKERKPRSIRKKLLSATLVGVMLVSMILPAQMSYAYQTVFSPFLVTGRILTPDKTGDISNWIEIARIDGFSLIVRQNFLNINEYYGTAFSPSWNTTYYGQTNQYANSAVRNYINQWFCGTAPGWADKLPFNARLRQYTVMSNAYNCLGTRYTENSFYDGLSVPYYIKAGSGNDVAFALSYSEAANYCCIVRNWLHANLNTDNCYSLPAAVWNFYSLNIPPSPAEVAKSFYYGMWLRSPGKLANTASALLNDGYAHELVTYQEPIEKSFGYSLVYPALWVTSDIFVSSATINVSHRYADTGATFSSSTETVAAPGPYGPYAALNIPDYDASLAPGSDPASGFVNPGDTKNIIWQYTKRVVQTASIAVLHLDLDTYALLDYQVDTVTAGDYGPYLPKDFPGYGPGQLIPGSDPASGTIGGGQTRTILYGYSKNVVAGNTITVIHQSTTGTILWQDVHNAVPIGPYGPYEPIEFYGYSKGFWDPTSAPATGTITANGTNLTIRFLYIVIE